MVRTMRKPYGFWARGLVCIALTSSAATSWADSPTTAPSDNTVVSWPWQYTLSSPLDIGQQGADPIAPLADRMGDVVSDLSALKTNQPTQAKEQQIVSTLDDLIAELQKPGTGSGGGNPNPTRPMARSQLTGGPGGSGPLHDPRSGTQEWTDLPPKERQQIMQSRTEGFPPGYESVLANYYTRLAQNQGAAVPGASDPGPTTEPTSP